MTFIAKLKSPRVISISGLKISFKTGRTIMCTSVTNAISTRNALADPEISKPETRKPAARKAKQFPIKESIKYLIYTY